MTAVMLLIRIRKMSEQMKLFPLMLMVMTAGIALGQSDLPISFKGACEGTQTDVRDLSAIQNTPAIKCDSIVVMQNDGHTVVSFSNGNPAQPVLMFSGDLLDVSTDTHFDPYLGQIRFAFPIDRVLWGDGSPAMSIQAGEHMDKLSGRGCYFHFIGQGWSQLRMVECELVTGTASHRPRRVTVTFKVGRDFTVDGKQIAVQYGVRGAKSFHTVFNGMEIEGSCGIGLYQIGGVLEHTEPGTPIARLFQTVCYNDPAAPQSQ